MTNHWLESRWCGLKPVVAWNLLKASRKHLQFSAALYSKIATKQYSGRVQD